MGVVATSLCEESIGTKMNKIDLYRFFRSCQPCVTFAIECAYLGNR